MSIKLRMHDHIKPPINSSIVRTVRNYYIISIIKNFKIAYIQDTTYARSI